MGRGNLRLDVLRGDCVFKFVGLPAERGGEGYQIGGGFVGTLAGGEQGEAAGFDVGGERVHGAGLLAASSKAASVSSNCASVVLSCQQAASRAAA